MEEPVKLRAIVYLDQKEIVSDYEKIDYSRLLSYINAEYDVVRATSYLSLDAAKKSDEAFMVKLRNCGWRCETNVCSISTNAIITSNLMNDKLNSDHKAVVVMSGHQELDYPLDFLAKAGYRVHVICRRDKLSINLIKVADKVTYLEDIDDIMSTRQAS